MAADASRSTASTASNVADSYIGSLISLTSKSDIRYEGFLFTINTLEASIGLRNVRSFGTEGRRMDSQVPASDKVYEYIVFRGSDIKDLQVKSSPPVQIAPQVHNDPAIIQSHYTAPSASSNFSPASVPGAGSLSDLSNQNPQPAAPVMTTYQNSVPMYPPVGNMPQWNPSPPTTNASGHSMPMYWQGYYGPSGPLQAQQQPLLRPVQGPFVPPPMQLPSTQQPGQFPSMNPSTGASDISVSRPMEFPPPLLHPVISSSLHMQPNVHPVQSSALAAGPSNMMSSKAPARGVSVVSQSPNPSLVSTMLPNVLDKSTVGPLIPNQAKPISSSMAFNGLSESLSAAVGKSTSPVLVTPGQFLQPGPTICPIGQMEQTDAEVVQVSSLLSPPQTSTILATATAAATVPVSTAAAAVPVLAAPAVATVPVPAATAAATVPVSAAAPPPVSAAIAAAAAAAPVPVSAGALAPLLPLPSPSNARMNGLPSQTRYVHRGGRDRKRGNEFSHPVANFTEDFDFEAMNEKFKKDEVWGHLGKSKAKADDGLDLQDEEDVDVPKVDSKAVYRKEDFFDTLSSNADRENRNGRARFSEQMKLDTETFGNFSRNRGYRGGRGPGGGRSRGGGYYGRGNGYGYVGRGGRGNSVYRAI